MKKVLSIALVAAMLFACVAAAIPVSAATSGDYYYSVNDDGITATITKYKGTQADVVIPSVIDGYTITSIGRYAFDDCTSLESITIPEGVTSIGESAFRGCTSLKSVTIPASVTSIGSWAFSNCSSLTEFDVDTNNPYYSSEDGVLFNKDKTNLIQYPIGNTRITYVIPEGVSDIGYGAFSGCTSLTSVTIPEGVTSIGEKAFSDCTRLASVTIPEGVTSIGDWAFLGCLSLASVTIPDSVTSIGWGAFSGTAYVEFNEANWENDVLFIDNHLIEAKGYISGSYNIPEGTKTISGGAFFDCTSLASVTIPDSVTSIGVRAFEECTSLTSVTIPDSVTSIGYRAFYGCTSLASVTIPEGVTSIGHQAFEGCTSLESVTIPDSVTSIGYGAFFGTAYESNEANWENDVLFIDNHLINANSYISGSYNIPEGTKTISGGAFYYCSSLVSVTIPESVTSIGEEAFCCCTSLTSVTIPEGVTSIEWRAFKDCTSLTSVTIPEGVTSIGGSAFSDCTSLKSVTIPASVTSIDNYAFDGCDNLVIYGYSGTAAEKYASDNRITFIPFTELIDSESNVTVSGVVPAETQLIVNKITATDTGVTYDITLIQNGEEIQPEAAVTVKIPVPAEMIGTECRVYREEASGSYTDMNAVFKDGFMVFITEHFSKYVITSEDLSVIPGDLDADGYITVKDSKLLKKYLLCTVTDDDINMLNADIDSDGSITTKDSKALKKILLSD